jgi:hypothetical protein
MLLNPSRDDVIQLQQGKIGEGGKSRKGPSEWWSHLGDIGWLIMWEVGEEAEVRGGKVDWGEGGLASEGADKQEDKNEEEGEVS